MNIDPSAVAEIDRITAQGPRWFRVSVTAGGCNGFEKHFELVDNQELDDISLVDRVLVDPISYDLIANATLSYQQDLSGCQFVLSVPEAVSNCGCGRSFAI